MIYSVNGPRRAFCAGYGGRYSTRWERGRPGRFVHPRAQTRAPGEKRPMSDWQRDVQTAYDRVAAEYAAPDLRRAGRQAVRPRHPRSVRRAGRAARAALRPRVRAGPGRAVPPGPRAAARAGRSSGSTSRPRWSPRPGACNPDLRFEQGTMLALDLADGQLGGIAAFYSIVNVPARGPAPRLRRVLAGACAGRARCWWRSTSATEDVHLDEWWDTPGLGRLLLLRPGRDRGPAGLTAGFTIDESPRPRAVPRRGAPEPGGRTCWPASRHLPLPLGRGGRGPHGRHDGGWGEG